jgi:hypothetical protein
MEIELRGGPLDGEQRSHALHPQLFGERDERSIHVWQRRDDQAWAPPDRAVPVYDYAGVLAI